MEFVYLVARVPYEFGGRLVETIGVFSGQAEADAACTQPNDAFAVLELDKAYPPGQQIPVSVTYPRCDK